jgi:hypothetical protein
MERLERRLGGARVAHSFGLLRLQLMHCTDLISAPLTVELLRHDVAHL